MGISSSDLSKYGFIAPPIHVSDAERAELEKQRAAFCAFIQVPVGVSGGGDGVLGGLRMNDLQNYGNSQYSANKEKLIRAIAKDVFTTLNHPAARGVATASIDTIVEKLSEMLHKNGKPRKFNKDFNNSSSSQKHVIRALANAINRNYGGSLIDLEIGENEMAEKVGEVIYSLIQGLHTEFMTVAGDAMRVMNNMQTVMNYVDAAYKKQRELIANTGDQRLREQSANTDEVYKVIKGEYERQSAVLANLLNITIGPSGKSLISSLEDSRDFVGLVKDLRTTVGTHAFGDKLAYLLSGISTAAHSAALIDKALKKIGLGVNDFKSAKNTADLRSKIFRHIMNSSKNTKDFDNMMTAAKVIIEANYDHDAVSKLLAKKGGADDEEMGSWGGNSEVEGGADSDLDEMDAMGSYEGGADGDDLPLYWQKKSLVNKLQKKEKFRDLILKDFKKNVRNHYRNIVDASNNIAHRIGNGLMLTENLKSFVEAFSKLDNVDNDTIHLALSGYPKDSTNKQKREEFLNKYKVVMTYCELLAKEPEGQAFKALGSAIHNMVLDIDNFSDKMVKAITEIHIDNPDEIANSIRKTSSTFYGAADNDTKVSDGSWPSFNKVVNEMVYYHSIANVKANLARANEDFKSYADDYEQILGEEAAWLIDRIRNNYLAKIELIKDEHVTAAGAVPLAANGGTYTTADIAQAQTVLDALRAAYNAGAGGGGVAGVAMPAAGGPPGHNVNTDNETKPAAVWALANLKTLWNFQMNAKVNMVKVAQAIDLYLKAFTDGITKNPDSISSVVKMLNEVEIVAKWFNDYSGDALSSLFEVFPCSPGDVLTNVNNTSDAQYSGTYDSVIGIDGTIKMLIPNDNHYYQYLEQRWHTNAAGAAVPMHNRGATHEYDVNPGHYNLPGNPFIGRPLFGNNTTPKQCKGLITLSKKVVASMRALENIISAFASVGSKLGDVDPLAKTFMNPGQIFNYLCDYVAASAFSTEFAPEHRTTAAAYHGATMNYRITSANGNQTIPTNDHATGYRSNGAAPAAPAAITNAGVAAGAGAAPLVGLATAANANDIHWSHDVAHSQNNMVDGTVAAPPAAGGAFRANNQAGILTGVSHVPNSATWRKFTSVALSAIPAESTGGINKWKYHDSSNEAIRYDVAGWRDSFFDTDHLFQMVIKSIVAKIFTVVDAYRLFHRPVVDRRSHYSLNPLRTILGGADDVEGGAVLNKVKIIPDALELYYRLVLLAEWYREHFGLDAENSATARQNDVNGWRITLVPSIDGVWSDLVEIIFDKAEYVKEGNYSETQVQRLILAINGIWNAYRSRYPKTTTRSILNAFVLEMNRAFGFLKQQQIDEYTKHRRDQYKNEYKQGETEHSVNYDILDAEDQFGERPAPSDRFSKVSARAVERKSRNMLFLQEAVEKLRKSIDVQFLKITQNLEEKKGLDGNELAHFQETIRNYRVDLSNAKSDVDEYKVVLRMLQGANKEVKMSTDKLIMVHETVAAPLVVLYAIYKVLARFNAFAHGTSLTNLAKFNDKRAAANNPGVGAPLIGIAMDNVYTSFTAYNDFMQGEYNDIIAANKNRICAMFARAFTGAVPAVHGHPTIMTPAGAASDVIDAEVHGYMKASVAVKTGGITNMAAVAAVAVPAPPQYLTADAIDGAAIMQDLLSALLDFSTNPQKLVTVNVGSNGNINLDFSAIEDVTKDLLEQVKQNIAKLRMSFTPQQVADILEKYEDLKNVGSTRWLEENLIETLFNNRDKCGLPFAVMHVQSTFNKLCRRPPGAAYANAYIGHRDEHHDGIDQALRGLITYESKAHAFPLAVYPVDVTKFPGDILPLRRELLGDIDKRAVMHTANRDPWTAEAGAAASTAAAAPLHGVTGAPGSAQVADELRKAANNVLHMPLISGTADPNKFDINSSSFKSLMHALNNVLHMYLYINTDEHSKKFYAPLIETFATSAASLELNQGKAFPNIANYDVFGQNEIATAQELPGLHCRKDNPVLTSLNVNHPLQSVPENTVIYASNAIICRSLLTTVTTTQAAVQKKKYLYDSLADAPEYMRDRMRVNMPYFIKLFNLITERATMLRQILTNAPELRANVASSEQNNAVPASNHARLDGCAPLTSTQGRTSDQMAMYFEGLLTRIVECGRSLRKCAEGVYKELQDRPSPFFEVSKDFLQEYRSLNGKLPVMPVSSILTPLQCLEGNPNGWQTTDLSHVLLPVKENGSMTYRFNYAARLVLGKSDLEVSMEHFPGAKDLYNGYAANAPRNSVISIAEYSNTVLKMVHLARFLIDGTVYGRFFNKPARQLLYAQEPNTTLAAAHAALARAAGVAAAGLAPANGTTSLTEAGVLSASLVPEVYNSRNVFHAVNWRDGFGFDADSADVLRANHNAIAGAAAGFAGETLAGALAGAAGANAAGVSYVMTGVGIGAPEQALALANTGVTPYKLTNVQESPAAVVAGGAAVPSAGMRSLSIYQLSHPLNNIIDITEGVNVATSKENLVKSVHGDLGGVSTLGREALRVHNILDAGIVPLNVHAFMREVPFVNLLNYSYTFDRMVHDFVLPSYISNQLGAAGAGAAAFTPDNLMISHSGVVTTTRELLVQLLVHPYSDLGSGGVKYFTLLASLFNGNDDLKLGRPRYLSDQLWHKALLTSSAELVAGQEQFNHQAQDASQRYDNNMRPLAAGPAAYQAARQLVQYGRSNMDTVRNSANMVAAAAAAGIIGNYNLPVSTSGLKYWDSKAKTWTVANKLVTTAGVPQPSEENMAQGDVIYCAELGKMRFDTKIVRNLTWFVQLQRIMRVVLTNHLQWINTPVVRGMRIADSKITEFNANEKFTEGDFDGSSYDPI